MLEQGPVFNVIYWAKTSTTKQTRAMQRYVREINENYQCHYAYTTVQVLYNCRYGNECPNVATYGLRPPKSRQPCTRMSTSIISTLK